MMDSIVSFFRSLFNPLWDALQRLFDFFNDFFHSLFHAIRGAVGELWIHVQEFALIIVENIPVPDFVYQAGGAMSSIPPGVMFFLSAFQVGPGLAMILGAYVLRFLVRRIPIIG